MKNQINNRKRISLLVMPVVLFLFAALFFWALGGGDNVAAQNSTDKFKGINAQLPGAKMKDDSAANKLSFYEQAQKDSLKRQDAIKNDPNYITNPSGSVTAPIDGTVSNYDSGSSKLTANTAVQPMFSGATLTNSRAALHTNEQQISQKLADLNKVISQQTASPDNSGFDHQSEDAERLQSVMHKMNETNSSDPQMEQLSGMLEKIQEIQNPGLVQEKLRKASEQRRGRVFAVSAGKKADPVSSLDQARPGYDDTFLKFDKQQNGFFSLDNTVSQQDSQNAIEAVIHETQTVVSGSTVKMRLTSDVLINGQLIPKGVFVYGTAALTGERLAIKIAGIRYNNNLFPVQLSVFDVDGLEGIYIPGAISRDVAKESADHSIQGIGLTTMDPSWKGQATSAGIEAAKSLFSKKIKLIRVSVKAGYQVLLRDDKQKQDQ